jgi:hypothetical protein
MLMVCLALPQDAIADYDYLGDDDPLTVDVEDSLDYAYEPPGAITFDGDMRGGYFNFDTDQRDNTSDSRDEFAARLR